MRLEDELLVLELSASVVFAEVVSSAFVDEAATAFDEAVVEELVDGEDVELVDEYAFF